MDIIKVEPRDGFFLLLKFENGESRIFDMKPYLEKPPFIRLKDARQFCRARISNGTVSWPGDKDSDMDLAAETLYDHSVPA